jgi:hypothetical protein
MGSNMINLSATKKSEDINSYSIGHAIQTAVLNRKGDIEQKPKVSLQAMEMFSKIGHVFTNKKNDPLE